jgi:actin
MADYSVHIVIDSGSSTCKAGFNGENAPRAVIPTVVGYFSNENLNILEEANKPFIGREALNNSSYLNLIRPIVNGVIKDFDQLEKIWSHIFYSELKVKPEAHNIFLVDSFYSSNYEREKMAEIMFEKFSIFNIHIEPQPIMALYSTTKTSGLIVETGERGTEIVPIFEGYVIPQGLKSNNLGGALLTSKLQGYLQNTLSKYNVSNPSEMCKKIKENFLEINLNENIVLDENYEKQFLSELSKSGSINSQNSFQLPDGNVINIGNERIFTAEALFNPELLQIETAPTQKLIYDSIKSCDVHLRKEFLQNIILGGGNSMVKNYPERLRKELLRMFKNETSIEGEGSLKINAQSERIYSAWLGASVVCSIGTFQQMWVSKNDYEEVGKNIIHKRSHA